MIKERMYYKHSGQFSAPGIAVPLVVGIIAAVILSLIYSYASHYIPFIYINFILTIGFGVLLGMAVGFGGKTGKIRNTTLMPILGALMGTAAVYAMWICAIFIRTDHELLIYLPWEIFALIQELADKGSFSISEFTPTGAALYAVWAIEAGIIIVASALFSWSFLKASVYCERCGLWVDDTDEIAFLSPIENPEQVLANLEAGNMADIESLKKVSSESGRYTNIELHRCKKCNALHLLTVTDVTATLDDDGDIDTDETDIVEYLVIDNIKYDSLLKLKNAPMAEEEKTSSEESSEVKTETV